MIVKSLKATNSNGDSITFGRHFRLIDGFDLSNLGAEVNYAENTRDGASYQNTLLNVRDFDITFFIFNNYQDYDYREEKRNELFRVFNPKQNPIRLDFITKANESYYLVANLEGTPSLPQGFENDNRAWQKGLLQFSCHDPYIYANNDIQVDIATWVGAFSFPLNIPDGEGIQMGYRSQNLIANAYNTGQSETGMIVRFKALATIVSPAIINVNTQENLKLNLTLSQGDIVEVSTFVGRKTAVLIRNNVKTNVFNAVDLYSTFLQLEPGDNLFRYEAETGVDNLEVTLTYTPKMVGV